MIPTAALYRIVKHFIPDIIESYEDDYKIRLKVQKIIYLFGQFRNENYYEFSWYLAGPYSSSLTQQCYKSLTKTDPASIKKWENLNLSEQTSRAVEDIKELIAKAKGILYGQLPDEKIYELVASIWYIATNNNFPSDRLKKVQTELINGKPEFSGLSKIDEIIKLTLKCIEHRIAA